MIEREHDEADEEHVRNVLGIMHPPDEPVLLKPAKPKDSSFESFDRMMRSNRGVNY